jgi:hypothetical protein
MRTQRFRRYLAVALMACCTPWPAALAKPPVQPGYVPNTATGTPQVKLNIGGSIDETDTTVAPTGTPHPLSQSEPAPVNQMIPTTVIGPTAYALTAAGAAQQLPSASVTSGIVLQNESASDVICIGTSNAVAYSASGPHCQNGYQLAPGQSQGFVPPMVITTASGVTTATGAGNASYFWWVGPTAGTSTSGDYLGITGN